MIDKKNGVEIGGVLEKYLRGKLVVKDDSVNMNKVSNNNNKLVGYKDSNNDKSS